LLKDIKNILIAVLLERH